MKRVVFIVEGDTEIIFIQKYVIPYLYGKGFANSMHAQKIITNRRLNKKGGNVGFHYLINEVRHVAATGNVLITTFIDFFRLPADFPGYTTNSLKISEIENKMTEAMSDIVDPRCFLPYIQKYEIESLMYTSMDGFRIVVDDERSLAVLQAVIDKYPNPEEINGGSDTAPSKRLAKIFPYAKTIDGELILGAIGIDHIWAKCPGFHIWMQRLERGLKNDCF